MKTPPVSFSSLAKKGKDPKAGGYPYTISGADLDKNFNFATVTFEGNYFLESTVAGPNGSNLRRVEIKVLKNVPKNGTHVLGVVDGTLQWFATEEC